MDPPSKRIKTKESDSSVEDLPPQLEELAKVQDLVEKSFDNETEQIMKIKESFAKSRQPLLEQRSAIAKQIPGFWLQVMLGHPYLSELLTNEEDRELLANLVSIDVTETDNNGSFKITFEFAPNKWLETDQLWKEFKINDDGTEFVASSGIKWKPGMDLTSDRRNPESDAGSFFIWFSPEVQDFELGNIIKNDLWMNPLRLYLAAYTEDLSQVRSDNVDDENHDEQDEVYDT